MVPDRNAMQRRTVLVVDDEPGIREVVGLMLEDRYHILEAGSGAEALRVVRRHPVDLMILDVRMPGLDGFDVLERVRAEAPATSVVMLTAIDSARSAVAALKLGACDYLTKPIDRCELHEAIDRAISDGSTLPNRAAPSILVASDHAGWRSSLAALLEQQTGAGVTTASIAHVRRSESPAIAIVDCVDRDPASIRLGCELAETVSELMIWGHNADVFDAPPRGLLFRGRHSIGALLAQAARRYPGFRAIGSQSVATVRALHAVAGTYSSTTVEHVADTIGLSPRQLSRVFRNDIGLTLKTYLLRVRVVAAKTLLRESSMKLESIAETVGLCNASYMARIFRHFEHMSPRAYRDGVPPAMAEKD